MFVDLIAFFDKNIKGEWPAHVQSDITAAHYKATWQLLDGWWSAVSYLPSKKIKEKADKALSEHMKPICEDIADFIKTKMQVWKTQSSACIRSYSDDLTGELNDLCLEFDAHIDASVSAFTGTKYTSERTAKGGIQTAIALFLGNDISAAVDISNEGGSVSWGALAGKFVGQTLIDAALLTIVPQAFVLKFVIDAAIIAFKANSAAQKRALKLGEVAIDG